MTAKTKPKHSKYLTPLDIPEGRVGDFEIVRIKYQSGYEMSTANMRCQMLGGQKSSKVSWPFETVRHHLLEGGARWMSDIPCEIAQMQSCIKGMKGKILVGGLGLGLVCELLAERKAVKEITVVELSSEVIELVAAHTVLKWRPGRDLSNKIINADLKEWLRDYDGPQFDYAFYDIWRSDGEGTFFDTVCPLYLLSQGKVKHSPVNWNEDVMRGQLMTSLQSRMLFANMGQDDQKRLGMPKQVPFWEYANDKWHDWAVPYFKWWCDHKSDESLVNYGFRLYTSIYGMWDWEESWDQFCKGL